MYDGKPPLLDLSNLAKGAAHEVFNEAVQAVAANISDPNTEPTQKRRITLTVEIAPYKDRGGASVSVKVEKKLAGIRPAETSMYIGKIGNQFHAFTHDARQEEMKFDQAPAAPPPPTGPTKPN
jgi:hypothetical protein